MHQRTIYKGGWLGEERGGEWKKHEKAIPKDCLTAANGFALIHISIVFWFKTRSKMEVRVRKNSNYSVQMFCPEPGVEMTVQCNDRNSIVSLHGNRTGMDPGPYPILDQCEHFHSVVSFLFGSCTGVRVSCE